MRRKYEVFIGGKPVVIGEAPAVRDRSAGWVYVRVDGEEEIAYAVKLLERSGHVLGLHLSGTDVERVWQWFCAPYTFVQAAGGAVTDERGRLLVMTRLGTLDLPKGKVEKGEEITTGAVREVQEECGLKHVELVKPLCETWHTYERNGKQHLKRTDWFLMRAKSSEKLVPQSEEDISDLRWMDAREVEAHHAQTYSSLLNVLRAWAAAVG